MKESDLIYIRNVPSEFQKRTRKIIAGHIAHNGNRFDKNEAYILIYENGLQAMEKKLKLK